MAYASTSAQNIHVVKRTFLNLDLDFDLVEQAREVLGSHGATDTIHRALEEVVRRERLRRLAAEPFEDLTPEALEQLRQPRSW